MNISTHYSNLVQNQKKYFRISDERNKEMGKAQDKGKFLLKTQGLEKALEHSYHQIAKDIGQYGTKHPYTATAFHQAAILHSQNGEPDLGVNLFKISHDIHKHNGADNNIDNCTSYGAIASTLFELGQYQEALDNGLKALKLYKIDSGNDAGDAATIRRQWALGDVYLELGKQKQKGHEFADARQLYAEGLKHLLDAEQAVHEHGTEDQDKYYCKLQIEKLKKQANTLPPPPEWLPSGTIKAMTEPFKDNKLPFTQPEPPLKAKL